MAVRYFTMDRTVPALVEDAPVRGWVFDGKAWFVCDAPAVLMNGRETDQASFDLQFPIAGRPAGVGP